MAVGDTALFTGKSYFALGRETTLGTYTTCTAGIDILSTSIITQQDTKILEQIERSRTYSKSVQMGKVVGGDFSYYLRPRETATGFVLQNAFGGTVTSSTATGETVGGGGFQHVFDVGCMDQAYKSLCANIRKGDSASGQVFEYSGLRVNQLTLSANLDDAVMFAATVVGIDSSTTSNDVNSALTSSANATLNFTSGRISVETTFASLTSTSFWHVISAEVTVNNNLKTGNEARRIGTDLLSVLPIGVQTYEFTATIRFNTTTAYDAMLAQTDLSAELEFLGNTLSGSVQQEGLLIEMQKVRVKDAGDPEISGPDGVLQSTVVFDVLRDESASGYALRATLYNDVSSYA